MSAEVTVILRLDEIVESTSKMARLEVVRHVNLRRYVNLASYF